MSNLPLEVVEMFGQTIVKVVPVTIALALVFTVLTHFWACIPERPGGASASSSPTSATGFSFHCSGGCCGSGYWWSAPGIL